MILQPLLNWSQRTSVVTQIVIGLILGIALALVWPQAALKVEFLGTLFISALKAVAPILVFVLVIAAVSNKRPGQTTHLKPILWLYAIGTLTAAIVGVMASMLFPSTLVLTDAATGMAAPGGIGEVLMQLLKSAVANPVNALLNANYIGILVWAVAIGIALRHGAETTRQAMADLSNGITLIIQAVIRVAPIGIFGLVASTVATTGVEALVGYAQLLAVLLGSIRLRGGNGQSVNAAAGCGVAWAGTGNTEAKLHEGQSKSNRLRQDFPFILNQGSLLAQFRLPVQNCQSSLAQEREDGGQDFKKEPPPRQQRGNQNPD